MSFELRSQQPLRKEIRRIIGDQLASALEALTDDEQESFDDRIHTTRKALKRVRAALRLVRPAIDQRAYDRENAAFRNAGRPLSEIRDAKVLVDTLHGLKSVSDDRNYDAAFAAAELVLRDRRADVAARVLQRGGALEEASEALQEARERLDEWTDIPNKRARWIEGVERVYQHARVALANAKAEGTVESLHEWRKQVKHLRHCLEILTPIRAAVLGRLASDAQALGEALGEDHDLAVLQETLAQGPCDPLAVSDISRLVARQRGKLQAEALAMGELLFRESPRSFARRLEVDWRHWSKAHRPSETATS